MKEVDADRTLRWQVLRSVAVVLLLAGTVRAEESQRTSIAVEGGWAHPLLDASTYMPADAYVGTTIPFRMDVGLRISEHLWMAPFVSVAWVQGASFSPLYQASSGFRALIGGELQLHSARGEENFDYFGGVGLAFERLVAHSRQGSCGHCEPDSVSMIGNGANLELRVGVLARFARVLRIGPYVGAQLAWMPGLAPVRVSYPDASTGYAGGTTKDDVSPFQLWFDVGLRVVFLL